MSESTPAHSEKTKSDIVIHEIALRVQELQRKTGFFAKEATNNFRRAFALSRLACLCFRLLLGNFAKLFALRRFASLASPQQAAQSVRNLPH
jgi:hypothetical protein